MNVQKPDEQNLINEIASLKKQKNAVILAHYYQIGAIQDLADYVGDSLALAQIAATLTNPVIVLCGVHFMGETAKILCPDKMVLIPDMSAGCSLADSCQADEFGKFVAEHPDYTVISYVNTSAAVKAYTDIVVTSSNARHIVESLPIDEKIIFGPDRNLGGYINEVTSRNMLLWNGACHVHERFSANKIVQQMKEHPEAKVLVHPESNKAVRDLADATGSTAALLDYARNSEAVEFIVATESGILHKMRQLCTDKTFIPAGSDDTCTCNECEYMKYNTLQKLRDCLRDGKPEIIVDNEIAQKAIIPIKRMLEMSKK